MTWEQLKEAERKGAKLRWRVDLIKSTEKNLMNIKVFNRVLGLVQVQGSEKQNSAEDKPLQLFAEFGVLEVKHPYLSVNTESCWSKPCRSGGCNQMNEDRRGFCCRTCVDLKKLGVAEEV